jgi:ankyrin repeat protein
MRANCRRELQVFPIYEGIENNFIPLPPGNTPHSYALLAGHMQGRGLSFDLSDFLGRFPPEGIMRAELCILGDALRSRGILKVE